MSLLDHIAELRRTLIWAVAMAAIAAVAAWFISDEIVNTLLRPAHLAGQSALYFHAPMEAFMLKLKASGVVGLLLVFPLILYKLYSFVLPGLTPREKRAVTPMLVAATALFYVGVSFCFFVLMPMVIRFALSFATDSLKPLLTAGYYFDFAAKLCLAFGILFELPMVIFALSWVGVVQPRTLLRGWRYALVAIATVSAILTPPDPLSQIMLLIPVMLLYLGSVLVAMVVRRRRTRDAEEVDEGPDDDGPDDDGPDDDGPDGDGTGDDGTGDDGSGGGGPENGADAETEPEPGVRKEPAPDPRPASDTVARERGDRSAESEGKREDPESDSPPSGGN
jgi:sec-independent protein translocase protein TatC